MYTPLPPLKKSAIGMVFVVKGGNSAENDGFIFSLLLEGDLSYLGGKFKVKISVPAESERILSES